jgi:hypothetical protein
VQQLLCLQLACVVLQLQRKRARKQQDSSNPAMQLLAALGLSAELNWSQIMEFSDAPSSLVALSFAINTQVTSASMLEAISGAADDAEALQQRVVHAAVVKPLLLTLLQLCGKLAPQLLVIDSCLKAVLALLLICNIEGPQLAPEIAAAEAAARVGGSSRGDTPAHT